MQTRPLPEIARSNAQHRLDLVRGAITLAHDAVLANNSNSDELTAALGVLDLAREEIDRIQRLLDRESLGTNLPEVSNG